jgi:starch synthase
VSAASPALLQLDARWVFLGTGDAVHEQFLRDLSARAPSRVGVLIGFDDGLAHLIEAGSDMFLMPSLFEPCGLNQMYSLRYGTVPIVHAVGGLEDTVQNYTPRSRHANGFKFRQPTAEALIRVVQAAVRLYSDRESWLQLIRQGMSEDHSWESSAREYVKVYKRARQDAATR